MIPKTLEMAMDRKVAGLIFLALAGTAAAQTPTWYRYTATAEQIAAVEAAVSRQMKDPESARFEGIYRLTSSTGMNAYCGQVNAKNSYGGYSGFTPFYYNGELTSGAHVWLADGKKGDAIIVQGACNKPLPP